MGFLFFRMMPMGLRLAALWPAGAPLQLCMHILSVCDTCISAGLSYRDAAAFPHHPPEQHHSCLSGTTQIKVLPCDSWRRKFPWLHPAVFFQSPQQAGCFFFSCLPAKHISYIFFCDFKMSLTIKTLRPKLYLPVSSYFCLVYTLLTSRGAILNIKFMTSFAERYTWVNKHGRRRTSRLFVQRGNSWDVLQTIRGFNLLLLCVSFIQVLLSIQLNFFQLSCEDIPGSLIELTEVGKRKKNELQFWLDCRNLKYKSGETRAELVSQWASFTSNIFV